MTSDIKIPFSTSPYIIYEGNNWNIILHRYNQSYLERCIVYLKNRVLENPLELTKEEHDELWLEILPKLARALKNAFQPDRINYAHLANADHFVHWHIIPRYERNPIREFGGAIFKDERGGKNYAPEPIKEVSAQLLEKIYSKIKENI